jgi:DNA-binding CsgD family transcriptional regulator
MDPVWLRTAYELNLRTARDIADEIGCSRATVYRALERNGIRVRTRAEAMQLARAGRIRTVDVELEAVRLYRAGYSSNEIALRCRLGKTDVFKILKRHGVQTRNKKECGLLRRDTANRQRPRAKDMIGVLSECLVCGSTRFLEAHHLDGNRADSSRDNLVALCWEHHSMVEFFISKALRGINRAGA